MKAHKLQLEQAADIRIHDLKEFSQYMANTFRASEVYLEGLKDEDLAQINDLHILGKQTLYQTIGNHIIQHGSNHLGEIWYLRGLQGLKGSPA